VLVAGAGRSGTSTVAGILQRLGLVVPKPEVTVDETNPRGFSECQWVVDYHEDLLTVANVQVSDGRPDAWQRTAAFADRPGAPAKLTAWLTEQFADADQLLIKDPRISWFLPLWTTVAQRMGADASFVTMLRPPPEVIGSKRTYYNSDLQDAAGTTAWVNMLLNTERATRGTRRTFVRYHDLLTHWQPVTRDILAALDLPQPAADDPRIAEVEAFVDPGLRRVTLTWDDLHLPERLRQLAQDTWRCLDTLADNPDDGATLAELDVIHKDFDAYYAEAASVAHSGVIAARRAALREVRVSGHEAVQIVGAAAARRMGPLGRLVPARLRTPHHR
jgi:hypothetical protein